MTIALDILILLVIGIGIWRGYKHGLVRTLIRLVGCILALVVAALLSRPVAEGIFDAFLQENIETTVAESVSATAGKTVEEHIAAINAFLSILCLQVGFWLLLRRERLFQPYIRFQSFSRNKLRCREVFLRTH